MTLAQLRQLYGKRGVELRGQLQDRTQRIYAHLRELNNDPSPTRCDTALRQLTDLGTHIQRLRTALEREE